MGSRTRNATFRHTDGLAIDHGICVGSVDDRRCDKRGESKSGYYERAHTYLYVFESVSYYTDGLNVGDSLQLWNCGTRPA